MFFRNYEENEMAGGRGRKAIYDAVIGEVFMRLYQKSPGKEAYDFDKDFLESAVRDLLKSRRIAKGVKNIPDIKYTYDAREEFPEGITGCGCWAIVGRGKSKYRFVKLDRCNLIRIPDDLPVNPEPQRMKDKIPSLVARVLGDDEQAILARVEHDGLVEDFTGLAAMRVQGHERTTVSAGQIEVDEVYVGQDYAKTVVVLPISAKGGGKDRLSYTQALNLNLYASEKEKYHGLKVRPLGITRGNDGSIYIVEFTASTDIRSIKIERVRRYLIERRD